MPCTDENRERALLSHLLRHPRGIQRVGALSATDFALEQHGRLWEAMASVAARGQRPTVFAVAGELKKRGASPAYAQTIADAGGVCESVAEIAEHVRTMARLRRVRNAALEVAAEAENGDEDAAREAMLRLLAVPGAADDGIVIEPISESVAASWERLKDQASIEASTLGVHEFDKAIGPLPGGALIVIGGYTGAGKSSLALMLASNAAEKRPVGIVSCEDPREVWGQRFMSSESGQDASRAFREPDRVGRDFWSQLVDASERSRGRDIMMAYAINQRPLDVVMAMRRLVRDHGCQLLVVDYLQAIRVRLGEVRTDKAYADAVKQMKGAAAELGVPLILCSQLKRPPTSGARGQPEPKVTDLKETGDLENEAEVILLCWRPEMSAESPTRVRLAKLKWAPGGALWHAPRNDSGTMSTLEKAPEDEFSDVPRSGTSFGPRRG